MEYFQFSSKILHYLSFFYLQIFLQIQNNTQYKTFINYLLLSSIEINYLLSSIEEYFQPSILHFLTFKLIYFISKKRKEYHNIK